MRKLAYSDKFKKSYQKLTAIEQKQVKTKLVFLAENPMHPSLRTKKIQGTNGLFESSANMSIRIIWEYGDEIIILLLDIGQHDIVKQF